MAKTPDKDVMMRFMDWCNQSAFGSLIFVFVGTIITVLMSLFIIALGFSLGRFLESIFK